MGGKTGTTTGLALLLLAAGMAWAGGAPGGDGNRGLSPIIFPQNDYENVRAVLSNLGIDSGTSYDHHNHFHVYTKPPTTQKIESGPQMLEVDGEASISTNDYLGDANMPLAYDIPPDSQLVDPPAMIAQAKSLLRDWGNVQIGNEKGFEKVITSCADAEGFSYLDPVADVVAYMGFKEDPRTRKWTPSLNIEQDVKLTILQAPKHGVVGEGVWRAKPEAYGYWVTERDAEGNVSYSGWDRVVYQVEVFGKKFKVIVNLLVAPSIDDRFGQQCERINFNANSSDSEVASSGSSYGGGATDTFIGANDLILNFSQLPGSSLGQTTGQSITLDTTAAGHGWYIDYTPYLNEEYLPTSNPYEWIAKEGSAAYGKMDLLSVLWHEYGHAMGLDHSSDSHDLMAATLTPGVRRLPDADTLAEFRRMLGYSVAADTNLPTTPTPADVPHPDGPLPPNNGSVRVTRARITRNGTFITGEDGVERDAAQSQAAANPTLTDPRLQTGTGWETTGSVSIGNGAAILTETATSQTRLNQAFIVGEHDRYLTFTLDGIALDDVNNAPDDAFEAALLDANTGLSLLGGTGLTRNDAFLNLQADGIERAGQGVTSTLNPDGSRTYRIDLAGIPAGTAVNLSFDLLGFGATTSQITVRDIRLGVPETRDDEVTTLEDTPIYIAVTANDIDADQPGFAPVVVSGPAHGIVTLNETGGFTYIPDADWNGEDSFTYKLSDGTVDSNIAKVSLGVTAVNDAPTAGDQTLATLEDTALTLDLLANASDIDSPTLTPVIVSGPQHGTLTQNPDGGFNYTPDANWHGEEVFSYKVNDGELDSAVATVRIAVAAVNDAPTISPRTLTLDEDTPLVLDLLAAAVCLFEMRRQRTMQ